VGALAGAVEALVWPVLLAGCLAGIALGVASAGGALARRRWPPALMGGALLLGGIGLVAQAAGDDTYYSPPITRWDYAARNGSRPLLLAALALTGAVLAALAATSGRRPAVRAPALLAAAVACGVDLAALFGISTGH
jgi:hypothetical protein